MKVAIPRSLALAVAAALLATAAGVACTPADVTDPFEQVCDDYAFAFCNQFAACSKTAIEMRFGTAAICAAQYKESCLVTSRAPHTAVTVATQTACTHALPMWDCEDFLVTQNPPPGCQALAGPLSVGATCSVRSECQSSFCGYPSGQNCGTCAPPPAAGASCADMSCASGYQCVGSPLQCQPYAGVGASCSTAGIRCATGLVCGSGACQPAPDMPDEHCMFAAGCDLNAALACDAATSTCQTARISPVGAPCGDVAGQVAACVAGTCIHGLCVAYPPLGAPCELGGADCLIPAACITTDGGTTGTCQIRGATACE